MGAEGTGLKSILTLIYYFMVSERNDHCFAKFWTQCSYWQRLKHNRVRFPYYYVNNMVHDEYVISTNCVFVCCVYVHVCLCCLLMYINVWKYMEGCFCHRGKKSDNCRLFNLTILFLFPPLNEKKNVIVTFFSPTIPRFLFIYFFLRIVR